MLRERLLANDLENQPNLQRFSFLSILFSILAEATLCGTQHQIESVLVCWEGLGRPIHRPQMAPGSRNNRQLHTRPFQKERAATFFLRAAQVNRDQKETALIGGGERALRSGPGTVGFTALLGRTRTRLKSSHVVVLERLGSGSRS